MSKDKLSLIQFDKTEIKLKHDLNVFLYIYSNIKRGVYYGKTIEFCL